MGSLDSAAAAPLLSTVCPALKVGSDQTVKFSVHVEKTI